MKSSPGRITVCTAIAIKGGVQSKALTLISPFFTSIPCFLGIFLVVVIN